MNATRYEDLEAALLGLEVPQEIRDSLALIDVPYYSFVKKVESGQLVIHRDLADDIRDIFTELTEQKFPIQSVIPIAAFNWNDDASMEANSTSAFNYRRIVGTDMISNHSRGFAIDINPLQNPYYGRDGNIYPATATYDPNAPGTISNESNIVQIFKKYGWVWLGERAEHKDYQHFEKIIE